MNIKIFLVLLLLMTNGILEIETAEAQERNNAFGHLKPTVTSGGVFRIGWHHRPEAFNPFQLTDTIAMPFLDLIFSRLVQMTSDGSMVPSVARDWTISEDQRTYTFHLRDDVYFHDGSKLTSEDVIKSFKSFSNKEVSPRFSSYFKTVREYRAPSEYVFEIELIEPFAPFLSAIWQVWILPSEKIGPSGNVVSGFEEHPIGSGSFSFHRQVENGSFYLKANENFFEGRPLLDEVSLEILPSKQQVWSAFMRGDLDMVFYLTHDNYQEIKKNKSFQVLRSLPNGGYVLIFNNRSDLLSNPKVRNALSLAIDRHEIVERTAEGEAVIINGPFHPSSWVYEKTPDATDKYDPQSAKQKLIEEGFIEKEGMLEYEGKPFHLNIFVDARDHQMMKIVKVLRQQLQEIGVAIKPKVYETHQELLKVMKEDSTPFHAYISLFNAEFDPNTASRYWETGEVANLGGYHSANVDSLFENARVVTDQLERRKLYQNIEKTLEQDKPGIFLFIPYAFHSASSQVINAKVLAGPYLPFYELKNISKKKRI